MLTEGAWGPGCRASVRAGRGDRPRCGWRFRSPRALGPRPPAGHCPPPPALPRGPSAGQGATWVRSRPRTRGTPTPGVAPAPLTSRCRLSGRLRARRRWEELALCHSFLGRFRSLRGRKSSSRLEIATDSLITFCLRRPAAAPVLVLRLPQDYTLPTCRLGIYPASESCPAGASWGGRCARRQLSARLCWGRKRFHRAPGRCAL